MKHLSQEDGLMTVIIQAFGETGDEERADVVLIGKCSRALSCLTE
jgi:hypothetical protein